MSRHSLSRPSDAALARELPRLAACDFGPDATLEQGVRAALKHLAIRARREAAAA